MNKQEVHAQADKFDTKCKRFIELLRNKNKPNKKEFREDGGENWIEQKQTDRDAAQKWA